MLIEMAPGLWLGDIDDAHDSEALNATGISAVFNITTNLPFAEGSTFVVQQRVAVEDDNDLKKLTVALPQLMLDIQQCIDDSRQVLVHCKMGRQRSACVIAAYYCWSDKSSCTARQPATVIKICQVELSLSLFLVNY
jgi:Dual specificity phosphatase, catalytic domain